MGKEVKKQEDMLLLGEDAEGHFLLEKDSRDLKAIGLFYAPSGGSVHKIARHIKHKITHHKVEMHYVPDTTPSKLLDYRTIIMVCSSLGNEVWNSNRDDKWATFIPQLRHISLSGRRVALVGLGDHVAYPSRFVDGMGDLAEVIEACGGVLIGRTTLDGYTFTGSRAVRDNLFVGLALDEDYESELTDGRIDKWLSLISPDL